MHSAPDPPDRSRWQKVLNESWPPLDVARTTPDRPPIPVRVRVVFERDGETWLDGAATRWHGQHVHAEVSDPGRRIDNARVWIDASDVRRR